MSDETDRGTARGLVEFLTYVKDKGLLATRTAEAYKSAASRILAIDGEDWLNTDLRSLDLEVQVDRFVRLKGTEFKPDTLNTYKSRFRSAISEYLRYIEDPISYRGPAPQRSDKPRKSSIPGPAKRSSGNSGASTAVRNNKPPGQTEGAGGRPGLVKYPFPLRSGQMAYFELPRDLSSAEAQRMAAFIASLAIDAYPELPAGRANEP